MRLWRRGMRFIRPFLANWLLLSACLAQTSQCFSAEGDQADFLATGYELPATDIAVVPTANPLNKFRQLLGHAPLGKLQRENQSANRNIRMPHDCLDFI